MQSGILSHMTGEELFVLAVTSSDKVIDAVEAELDRRARSAQTRRMHPVASRAWQAPAAASRSAVVAA